MGGDSEGRRRACALGPAAAASAAATHVVSGHKQPNAVWPAHVAPRRALVLVSDIGDQALRLDRRPVDVTVVQRLAAHVAAQGASIRRQAREGDAHVVIDAENLLLVRRQLAGGAGRGWGGGGGAWRRGAQRQTSKASSSCRRRRRCQLHHPRHPRLRKRLASVGASGHAPLDGGKHGVSVARGADGGAALLHRLHGVLGLEKSPRRRKRRRIRVVHICEAKAAREERRAVGSGRRRRARARTRARAQAKGARAGASRARARNVAARAQQKVLTFHHFRTMEGERRGRARSSGDAAARVDAPRNAEESHKRPAGGFRPPSPGLARSP